MSNEDGFGWEGFTLATAEAKLRYLAAQIVPSLGGSSWGSSTEENKRAVQIAYDLTGAMLDPDAIPHVDHQSQWVIPHE